MTLLKLASVIQYTVYGVPSVFYGDEAGMEGYRDPFCRRPFPWGREDKDLQAWYARLGQIRKLPVFAQGDFRLLTHEGPVLAFMRGDNILVCVNRGEEPAAVPLPAGFTPTRELLTDTPVTADEILTLPPMTAGIYM